MTALFARLRAWYRETRAAAAERAASNETPEARYEADMVASERRTYGATRELYERDT